jgi:hypothetical protein
MKKLLCLIVAAFALPMALKAETWKNVPLMDSMCAAKSETKANPDAHSKTCAIQCEKSGYGILSSDGKFLKFDAAGNKEVQAALKSTKKTDHLRVDVEGQVKGDEIAVKSVSLD